MISSGVRSTAKKLLLLKRAAPAVALSLCSLARWLAGSLICYYVVSAVVVIVANSLCCCTLAGYQ